MADIGVSRFAETGALHRYPDRVINVGIREQLLISVAAGMALEGMRPIAHSYTPFLIERPYEQIKLDFAHQDTAGILVSIGASFDAAGEGRTHQSPADVGLIAALPGWEVNVPGHPDEVEEILRRVVPGDGRAYVRLDGMANREAYRADGRINVVKAGSALAPVVIAVGPMLNATIAATQGMDATVLYTATPHPFDGSGLLSAMGSPEIAVIEPYLAGTSVASVSAVLEHIPHRLVGIGVPNVEHRHYGTPTQHVAAHGLDPTGLRRQLRSFFDRTTALAGDSAHLLLSA